MDPALAKEVSILSQHRALTTAVKAGDSEIQKFYNGATVFITGGSGFMGKQLIEKLLRTCEIEKIFLLLRPKKGKNFYERLDFILKDPVFNDVRKLKPDFAKKLYPIGGNICETRLGISDEDWALVTAEVQVIIHGAATVNFDEPIKVAALTNVRGTVETLKLGKACKNLRTFIHISTAFSHATKDRVKQEILEQFYQPPIQPDLMIQLAETVDDQRLNAITAQLIQGWPNTYTFTKAIAEEAVRQMSSEIPVCVVRPAIVIASNREPSPGWLDVSCAFGPSGLILGAGLGVMHAGLASQEIKIDMVPVDLVNNAIIVAGWANYKRWQDGNTEAKIYTVTSMRNFIYWGVVVNVMKTSVLQNYATPKAVWYSFIITTTCKYYYLLLTLLWHYIPAYLIDTINRILFRKPTMVKLYKRVDKLNNALAYFTCNEWESSDTNTVALQNSLSTTDQRIFNFDMKTVDWQEQLVVWAIGVRKYIVKDGLQGTETGINKQYWFRIAHYLLSVLYFFVLYKLFSLTLSLGVHAVYYVSALI